MTIDPDQRRPGVPSPHTIRPGGEIEMGSMAVRAFTGPDAYYAGSRARGVEGVGTARGNFHAELTRIDFERLLMQRADENLPRVLLIAARPERIAIIFATDQAQPALHVSGLALARGEIITWDSGLQGHHRSATACRWGSMSFGDEEGAAAGGAIIGRELTPPSFAHRIRPPAHLLTRLLSLIEAAGHIAMTTPSIIANPPHSLAMAEVLFIL